MIRLPWLEAGTGVAPAPIPAACERRAFKRSAPQGEVSNTLLPYSLTHPLLPYSDQTKCPPRRHSSTDYEKRQPWLQVCRSREVRRCATLVISGSIQELRRLPMLPMLLVELRLRWAAVAAAAVAGVCWREGDARASHGAARAVERKVSSAHHLEHVTVKARVRARLVNSRPTRVRGCLRGPRRKCAQAPRHHHQCC